jgi:Flp pilus assembly protein TadD
MTREQALDRSLGLQGDHAAANLLSGQVAMDELRANGRNDEAAWQAVRDKIRMAIQVDSDNPMALKAYYDSFIGERRPASAEAVQAMARAFALAPELPSVRTAYAWSLARGGDLLGADRVMQKLALDPQSSSNAAMISVQFAGMRKLKSAAG